MPLVTLIIPVYNAERYLRRSLDSVSAQTFSDMEVLLLNDGSKDGSLGICREYEKKDVRFRVIDKENSGVSDTRNLGMRLACGKYLQFMDSDDWLTPDATESLVQTAERDQCDFVIADFYRVKGKRYVEKRHIRREDVMSREEFAMEMAKDPADFDRFIALVKELSFYDTGVAAEYGDTFFTLSTCSDSGGNNRFVVVAKRLTEEKYIY